MTFAKTVPTARGRIALAAALLALLAACATEMEPGQCEPGVEGLSTTLSEVPPCP